MSNLLKKVAKAQQQAISSGSEPQSVKRVVRTSSRPEDALWSFSFRHWRERDFFGLVGNGIDNKWLVSVIDRLHALSKERIERFLSDIVFRKRMRFHAIDWSATNIPIAESDLALPIEYAGNPEFALHQFQVSTGQGRIVGFFDERWIFNVVLLDPLHNLQPAGGKYEYKVCPSAPLHCELTRLREAIKRRIAPCEDRGCSVMAGISRLVHAQEEELATFQILMIRIDDEEALATAKSLVDEGKAKSLSDIFETGILQHI